MLRFFRHIRKKLIEEEKVRKYLWYALGEILLVMIGILLALQINTWNQQRIDHQKSVTYHERLVNDLDLLINDLKMDTTDASNMRQSILASVDILASGELSDTDKELLDFTLNHFFQMRSLSSEISSYEELKNTGQLGLIYNVELRKELSEFITYKKSTSKIFEMLEYKVHNTEFINPYVSININEGNIVTSPGYDFNVLASATLVRNTLSRYALHWRSKQGLSSALIIRASELKEAIESELTNLK